MPTVEITSNQLYLNVPMHLYGNVGMGTDDPTYPLHVTAPKVTTASLSNISYENFTLDPAYTNRIPLSLTGNTDDGAALIPDFGFNFFINNVNYRQSTYVGTNGYVTFGDQFTLYDQPMTSFTVPTLFVGYTNIVVNQVSYSIGTYAGAPAVYIFFDGYDITAPSRLNEWCVVLQSNGNMRIWMKTIHNDSQGLFGLSDGKGNWLVQLPENNSTPDPAIVNTGYLLAMVHTPVGIGMGVKGDIIANGDMLITGAIQASSVGLSSLLQYPPLAMKSNTVGMTHALYGNGTYTALSSSPDGFVNDPYHLFEREETSEFLQWGYDATTSLYFGTTSTDFVDATSTPASLTGEWVQLKFPSAVTLTSYGIKPVAAYITSAPRLYAVLGSSDGSTWYLVDDHRTSDVSYVDASEKIMVVTPALSIGTAYSYYRFVTNAISTGGTDPHVRMQQLNFYIKNRVSLQGDTTAIGNLTVLGNVGIGTSSPAATLEIVGTIKATQFIGDGSMLTGTSGGGGGGEPSGWTSNVEYVYTTNATNVGIGTTTPNASLHVIGDILVQGTILPATCNTYDLGSSNYRFRDLYLSGNTIDIEGTRISKDQTTGGISITNDFNQLLNAQVNSLYASGNIGIGTTVALYPLHVKSIIASTSFTSVTYEDYTLWDAYDPSKRTTFPLSVNEDEESFLLPDIGFDFIYNGVNYRDSLWVCTNSYITFGTQFTEYNPEPGVAGLFENIPTLFVGADDSITNFISYYKGTYNGRKAMFVFFDAKDYESETLFQKWCVVIQSDKIWVFMNLIETYPNSEFGLWNGSEWDVQFPENLIGTNISTTAYVIHLKKENDAILFDGNVSTKGNTIIDGSTQLLNSTKRTGLYKSYASNEYDDYTTWSAYQNKVSVISNNDKVSAILPDFGFDFYISDKNFRKQCFVNVNSFISFGGPMQTYYYLNNSGYKALFIGPVDVGGIQIFANDISYSIGTYNDANAVYVFYDGIASTNNFYKWCVIFDEKNQIHVFLKEIYSTEPNCVFGIGLGTGIYDWYMQLPHCYTIPSLNNIAYSITIDTVPYGEALHVEGTGFFAGNIGIGTTSAYPLQIAQSPGGEYTSYINTVFEDYTLWAEYTNRRNLFVFPDTNDGFTLIPDFGFDFYIGSKNIRLQSFAITNSYITFGGSTTAWTNANNLGLVGLHLGSAGTGVEFISYSYGVYNSKQSIFVFFDGYDYYDYYNKKIQWCVIFSSDNSISILIKKLHMGQNASIGLGTGNGTWNVQLPGHNTTPDPAIVDTAYRLIFNIKPYGNALFVQGNIICNDNIGIGTTSPTAKLDVVGTVKATQFIGDGSLLTGLTSGWISNATSIYNTSQNVGIGTATPTAKLHVFGTSAIGKGIESRYPPSPLTTNTTLISNANYGTGSYVASASHTTFGDQPFYLFDFNDANTFHQGEARYSGGYTFNSPATSTNFIDFSSTPQTILGEWVQIRLPEAIKLNRYIIKPRDGFLNRSPRAFALLGSSDESSWYLIDDHRTNVVTYDDATEKVLTPTQPQTVAYNYYRLVTNAVNGGEQYVNFNELKLYANNDQPMLTVDGDTNVRGNIGLGSSSITTSAPLTNIYHDGTGCTIYGNRYNVTSGTYDVFDISGSGLWGVLPDGLNTYPGFACGSELYYLVKNSSYFTINGSIPLTVTAYRTGYTSGFYGKYVIVYGPSQVSINGFSANNFVFYTETNRYILKASSTNTSSDSIVTRLVVQSDGNVGIGSTQPTTPLDVGGTVKATQFIGDGSLLSGISGAWTSNGEYIYTIATNVGIGTSLPLAKTHIYHTGLGDILRIDDETAPDSTPFVINKDGNVGIGLTNPTSFFKLDVNGWVNAQAFVGSGGVLTDLNVNNVTYGTLGVAYGGIGTASLAANKLLVGNGTSSLIQPSSLHWDNTNSSLGIGSTQPTQALDVSGNATFSGNLGIGTTNPIAKTHIYYTGIGDILRVDDETAPDASPFLIKQDGNVGIGTTNVNAKLHIYHTGVGDIVRVDDETAPDTSPFLIKQDGNVGVGTTNPNAKLQVVGTVSATQFIGDGSLLTGISNGWTSNATSLYNTTQNVGVGITTSSSKLYVYGTTTIGKGVESRYPPSALTANTTITTTALYGNGSYIASASHADFADQPYYLFDYNDANTFHQGGGRYFGGYTFNSPATSTDFLDFSNTLQTILGEWIQIKLADTIKLSRYGIKPREGWLYRSPRVFVLLGSSDGSTWYLVDDHRTNVVSYADATEKILTLAQPQTNAYNYYRLVTNAVNGSEGYVNFNELKLYAKNDQPMLMVEGDTCIRGSIGIGTTQPLQVLDVIGNAIFSGNVGIGTTNPVYKLHINGGVSAGLLSTSGSSLISCYNPLFGTSQKIGLSPSLTLDFSYPVLIQYYTIQGQANSGLWDRQPIDFTIQGSMDNITYTVIDTRTSVNWAILTPQIFTISPAATNYYRYYRMVPTAIGDNSKDITYPEWYIYATPSSLFPSSLNVFGSIATRGNAHVERNITLGSSANILWRSDTSSQFMLQAKNGLTWKKSTVMYPSQNITTIVRLRTGSELVMYENRSTHEFMTNPNFDSVTYGILKEVSTDQTIFHKYDNIWVGDAWGDTTVGVVLEAQTDGGFRIRTGYFNRYIGYDESQDIVKQYLPGDPNILTWYKVPVSGASIGYTGNNLRLASSNEAITFVQNTTEAMRIAPNGNIGIGTTNPLTTFVVNGTIRNINGPAPSSGTSLVITASGDIVPQSSDARYKTNVEDLPSVLDAMMNMRAVSYQWKEEPQKWYGLLAQQVSEVFPDAAWHNAENDTYGVHYTPTVVTLLLKAMQEMKLNYDQRISSLETELENIRGVLPH